LHDYSPLKINYKPIKGQLNTPVSRFFTYCRQPMNLRLKKEKAKVPSAPKKLCNNFKFKTIRTNTYRIIAELLAKQKPMTE
jgi:hypothetical protein